MRILCNVLWSYFIPLPPPRSISPTSILFFKIRYSVWSRVLSRNPGCVPSTEDCWPTSVLTRLPWVYCVGNKVLKTRHFHLNNTLVLFFGQRCAYCILLDWTDSACKHKRRYSLWNGGSLSLMPSLIHNALKCLTSEELSKFPKSTSDSGYTLETASSADT